MSAGACQVLRHDVNPRWVGDLLTAYCLTCECLCVRDLSCPDPAPGGDSPLAVPRSAGAPCPGAQVGSQSVQADAGERARRGPRSSGRTAHLAAPATTAGLSSR